MAGSGTPPVVHRPIPRRPFSAKPARATKRPSNDGASAPQTNDAPSLPRLLERQVQLNTDSDGSTDLSRTQSIRNLTASTLFGIFSPTASTSPAGTGAETPATDLLADGGDDADDDDADDETPGAAEEFRRTTATAADLDEVRRASRSLMMLQYQNRTRGTSGAGTASRTTLAPANGRRVGSAKRGQRGNGVVATAGATTGATTGAAPASPPPPLPSRTFVLVSTVCRAILLFFLGMGYGALVTRLRSEASPLSGLDDLSGGVAPLAAAETPAVDGSGAVAVPRYDAITDWRYLISWGVSGVVLGTLLPWFDGVWERAFGSGGKTLLGNKGRTAPDTDWALVVRGIGAFAGVVFAMRKLPWASTMQASLTLALANPFLWYLLDRSKSGLLLSAAFCFLGTGVLVALDLDLLPNPGLSRTRTAGPAYGASRGSSTGGALHPPSHNDSQQSQFSAAAVGAATGAATGAGAAGGNTAFHASAPAVTAETAIWMLSVLFCSCVCFGSIGRRLALRVPAAAGQQRPR